MAVVYFATVKDMMANTASNGDIAEVSGYYRPRDGGGGRWMYRTYALGETIPSQNGGTIIKPDSSLTARWLLLHDGVVSVRQFGAIGDGTIHTVSDTINSWQRFTGASDVKTKFTTVGDGLCAKGRPLELVEDTDTLDWVAFQAAIHAAVTDYATLPSTSSVSSSNKSGFKVSVPQGYYFVRKPVWVGYGEHAEERDGSGNVTSYPVNFPFNGGLEMEGESVHPRAQGESYAAAAIVLQCETSSQIGYQKVMANRYTLRLGNGVPSNSSDSFKLAFTWVPAATTSGFLETGTIRVDDSLATIKSRIDTALGVSGSLVECPGGGTDLQSESTIVITLQRNLPTLVGGTKSFHGDIKVVGYSGGWGTGSSTKYARCYSDSAVVVFRGSAQRYCRVANLGLLCTDGSEGRNPTDRYLLGVGIINAHTTFTGFSLENLFVHGCRWGYAILENNSANGEGTYLKGVKTDDAYGLFYCNAGQAFDHTFVSCHGSCLGPVEAGDSSERNFCEIGNSSLPGYGFSFIECGYTFKNPLLGESDDGTKNCLLRMKKAGNSPNGIIRFEGGRYEHVHTLVDWDTSGGAGRFMAVTFNGMSITGVRSDSGRVLLNDRATTDANSEYTLDVRKCSIDVQSATADSLEPLPPAISQKLILQGSKNRLGRIHFEGCIFEGFEGREVYAQNVRFADCMWRDTGDRTSGYVLGPLRMFKDAHSANAVVGSRSDMPREIQSGPTVNRLKNSGNPSNSSRTANTGWTLASPTTLTGYQKFGVLNDALGLTVATEEGFAVKMGANQTLSQPIDLTGATGVGMAQYSAFVRAVGDFDIALVRASDSYVYDLIRVTGEASGSTPGAWHLVSLMASQKGAYAANPVLQIKCITADSILECKWQGAHYDRGPFSTIASDDNLVSASTQHWTAVLQELRVPGRFQLPTHGPATGYLTTGWSDLRAGEVFFDTNLGCLLCWDGAAWFVLADSETWVDGSTTTDWTWAVSGGNTKAMNVRYADLASAGTVRILTLSPTNVPRGKRVCVRRDGTNTASVGTIQIVYQTGQSKTLSGMNLRVEAFVFDGTNWVPEWDTD